MSGRGAWSWVDSLSNIFSVSYFLEALPRLARTLGLTLQLSAVSAVFALILGCATAIIRFYRVPVLRQITSVYLSIFRSTPLMPQLFLFYFGLATVITFIRDMDAITAACIIMSLHQGSYMAENIRGALLSVDDGQKEAAASLGFSSLQTMFRVILPQATRVALPPLFNDFVSILKMSSVVFVVGVTDLMGQARIISGNSGRYFEVYVAVMVLYWIIVNLMNVFQRWLERRCAEAY